MIDAGVDLLSKPFTTDGLGRKLQGNIPTSVERILMWYSGAKGPNTGPVQIRVLKEITGEGKKRRKYAFESVPRTEYFVMMSAFPSWF